MVTDWFFRIPAIRVAEARAGVPAAEPAAAGAAAGAAADPAPTWVYRFDYPDPEANNGLGACHGAEIPFVFDTVTQPQVRPRIGDTPAQTVADTMHHVWVSFITDGTPGWAPYTRQDRMTALITDKVTKVADPAGDERLAWDGIR